MAESVGVVAGPAGAGVIRDGRDRAAAVCGLAGVALNVLAVALLKPVPHTYKPGHVDAWLTETLAAPQATTLSAWAFTVGLAALVPFCVGLARRDRGMAAGAALVATGALINAAGTLAPIAALHVERPVGMALLWLTLLADSAFNCLLGLGLLAMALGMRPEARWPRGLRALAVVAGLASLPVALQFSSDTFASLLVVSGPLWSAWIVWTSAVMGWRRVA